MNLVCVIGHVFSLMAVVSSLRLMELPPLNCTQEGLSCSADIRSILVLKGTMVHILKKSTKESLCVFYIFHNKIKQMVNPSSEAWSFSLDGIIVDPGQTYLVSVSNLPVPNIGHNKIDKTFTIPGCSDPKIQETTVCRESGSLWKPDITWKVSTAQAEIIVSFNSSEFSEKYTVSIQCPDFTDSQMVWKMSGENETSLSVMFAMDQWPGACCDFHIVIQPFFPRCSKDCARQERFKDCIYDPGHSGRPVFIVLFLGLLFGCASFALCIKKLTGVRKPSRPGSGIEAPATPAPVSRHERLQTSGPRRVLLIYSLDHPLYRDIVLKLCAFLRARCGTDVVLDLLDSAWLGAVGRMQWLDWQKQQIEKSSDKILVLCSRGVRAKWRAMCGGGRVLLREDLRSPTGDMLTPALNLIIPDVVHSTSFQKYIVAYFEDVSCEDDVPAPFNITIKYKLMKHFEELYFRILEEEQHEPGRVNRIEGIAQDEYFNCPSGRALRDAIEALQAYQLENPDWFEKECVDSEEEAAEPEQEHPLLAAAGGNPTFQCVPEIREGPPVLVREVEFNGDARGVQGLIPLVNQGGGALSANRLHAGVHPSDQLGSRPGGESDLRMWSLPPSASEAQPGVSGAGWMEAPGPMGNALPSLAQAEGSSAALSDPVDHREDLRTPARLSSLQALQRSSGLGQDVASLPAAAAPSKRPHSGSDQGYMSRSSHPWGSPQGESTEDPLEALSRLQAACLLSSLQPSSGAAFTPDHH